VFIFGSRDAKIRRLVGLKMHEKEAAEMVDTIDHERALFVRKYFNAEWPCRRLYHMMLNSDSGIDFVADTILHTMDKLEAAQNFATSTGQPDKTLHTNPV
jgi:Cytidylate kinase-like family